MSSSHTIFEEMMYVKKLDVYYGATAYALYPSQSILEDLHGLELQSYVSNLAEWLVKGILSSQSLFKILTSVEPLLSPEIRSGTGRKGWMSSLPARILDDYMICRTRAYYTAHPESFKPRRILDMEESRKHGEVFIRSYLIPEIRKLTENTVGKSHKHEVMKLEESKKYYLIYKGLEKEITCKPDMVVIILFHGKLLRILVLEAAETDSHTVLRKKHIIPRILLYMIATYLHYGIPSAGLYISLSPKSSPPVIALIPRRTMRTRKLVQILKDIRDLVISKEIPKPSKNPICSHCVYKSICKFAM